MPRPFRRTPLVVSVIALALACAAGAWAASVGERQTTILSPPATDGGSDNVVFSQDDRQTRLIAYDSDAANIVPGGVNGLRDVFVHIRSTPGANGNFDGSDQFVSVRNDGQPANGPSENANIDGDKKKAPHCIVFESGATNLDAHDANPDTDIFIRDLRRRTTKLVSFGRANAHNPSIDGECE